MTDLTADEDALPRYRRTELPVEDRVEDLLSRLSVEEKAGQLTQFFYLKRADTPVNVEALPPEHRAMAEQPKMVEDAIRAGRSGSVLYATDATMIHELQRIAIEESPHGIPLLFGFDVIHGFRTIFPVPVALAATWSEATVEAAQSVAAAEARSVGIHWTFAPMLDITHDARWGRIVEGAGEDPVLASALAAAQVRGFQGDLGPRRILAGPKHFAGYGAARGGRDYDDVEVSESELWNTYLPPFRAAVEAGARTVMSAYMDLNGVPASANRWLLNDVLRDELGFGGFVVSDANSVRSLTTQHFARDLSDAAVRALSAGLDMEMSMFDPAYSRLPAAVDEGRLDEGVLDDAVRRVLTVKFELGLFERPYAEISLSADVLAAPAHREIAREAAEKSFVLLRNEGEALPLTTAATIRIALIGELADSGRDTLGPWVFVSDPEETVTLRQGLELRLPETEIVYVAGVGIPDRVYPSPFGRNDPTYSAARDLSLDDEQLALAVEAAAAADVAVVVVGQRQDQSGEKASTSTLDLPGRQLEQLQRIMETGTPVVLVVMSARPLDLRWADANVPAIIQAWHPGTRGGDALAAVLTGDVSPSGRLPFSWPRHAGQLPFTYAHNRTFEPANQAERYFGEPSTPLYPFGHGLSYASFSYASLRTDRASIARGEVLRVSIDVTNGSQRDADEVVQLYIHQRYGASSRPVRELKAFRRVTIAARATATVTFELGPDQLRYWSSAVRDFVQDETELDIWVGASSEATLHTAVTVAD
ncbi:glycoside hydrolase family 3 N-terminal domain-containing protein [Microbacterium sp. Leaf159]|uniref:glycoside hydrolase family 3 N-terminal domain-containing protein n=1 Tax=Microbacterium sp. Leaf159 TaxID=1736279 RepID=UPI000A59D622|nr:glycoside hydrolase family 3 N-terminal domain-containing protein [Microbacterium sp. Leaf159]